MAEEHDDYHTLEEMFGIDAPMAAQALTEATMHIAQVAYDASEHFDPDLLEAFADVVEGRVKIEGVELGDEDKIADEMLVFAAASARALLVLRDTLIEETKKCSGYQRWVEQITNAENN